MAFTYTGDLTDPLQYVRFRIGDKHEEFPLFQDEEIQYFIDDIGVADPSKKQVNGVVILLLKQILREILMGPSRERAGAYEVYSQTAQGLELLIEQIEDEMKDQIGLAKPSYGGVYKCDVKSTRKNQSYIPSKFHHGRIFTR